MNTEQIIKARKRRKLAWYQRQYGSGLAMGYIMGMATGLVLAAIIVGLFS